MTDTLDTDEPLDPKVEAVRRKMVMLLALSGGIMMIGLMTVLVAIVYRLNGSTTAAAIGEPVAITLPAQAMVSASHADDSGLTLTLTLPDGQMEIRRFDTTGTLTGRYLIDSQPVRP